MALNPNLSRRRVLQLGASSLAVVTLGSLPGVVAGRSTNARAPLVPTDKLGTILFTQRDAISRRGIWNNPSPTMGFLGGPGFPEDPTDLGPLVPLPGGFYEVFEYLANLGFRQIEFAGYGQNSQNRGGTAPALGSGTSPNYANFPAYLDYGRTLRSFLDEFGLQAVGNHGFIPNTWPGPSSPGGGMNQGEFDRFQLELEFASILGTSFMGTGNDPTISNQVEAWDVAIEKWEALNELSAPWGISIYPHNHADAYDFLQDGPIVEVTVNRNTGEPLPSPQMVRSSSGIRKMQYYLENTDPSKILCEIDIYWAHVAQHRFRGYYDANGNRVESIFDPLAQVASQPLRYPLYHAKDGDSTGQAPGVGNGYNIIPFGDPRSDIDYQTFLRDDGPRGYPNPNYEQDNAPGGGSDPGQSLRHSAISVRNMSNLRG